MTKPLIACCAIVLITTAIVASLVNIQRLPVPEDKAFNIEAIAQKNEQIAWVDVLEKLPQYAAQKTVNLTVDNQETPPQILDAKLIGIVVDEPSSVLLLIPKNMPNEPVQLSRGESWLDGWTIEKVLPDSVIWVNQTTNKNVTQFLFGIANNGANQEQTNLKSGKK